jgi:hypothetical protein
MIIYRAHLLYTSLLRLNAAMVSSEVFSQRVHLALVSALLYYCTLIPSSQRATRGRHTTNLWLMSEKRQLQ